MAPTDFGSGRERTPNALRSAAAFLRRSQRASGASGKSRRAQELSQRDALSDWIRANNAELTLESLRAFAPTQGGGAEHDVYFDPKHQLAIKCTKNNRFGWSVDVPGAHATPYEYLQRLHYCNFLLGDDIRLLGGIIGDDYLMLVISQPWIAAADQTQPSDEQIVGYLATRHFFRTDFQQGMFYSPQLGLVAADANERNMVVSRDGKVIAFDIVIGKPGRTFASKLRSQFPHMPPLWGTQKGGGTSTANVAATIYLGMPPRDLGMNLDDRS